MYSIAMQGRIVRRLEVVTGCAALGVCGLDIYTDHIEMIDSGLGKNLNGWGRTHECLDHCN